MVRKIHTTEELIQKFIEIHNDKYNYSKVILGKCNIPVIIICLIHGEFPQLYSSHLDGKGCKFCGGSLRKTTEQYIAEAKAIHGDKYDYSLVEYNGNKSIIKIICKQHGIFEQEAKSHIINKMGHGCGKCDGNAILNNDDFIEKAKQVHGDKCDYSLTSYIRSSKDVKIICKKHGMFPQRPNNHLSGKGCRKCTTSISKPEIKWLNYLNINEEFRHKTIKINNRYYNFDAFDSENKIIYEFYGDFWHGNPNSTRFKPDDINKMNKKTFGELYQKTIDRENELKALGYNVISIWESDWNKIKNI